MCQNKCQQLLFSCTNYSVQYEATMLGHNKIGLEPNEDNFQDRIDYQVVSCLIENSMKQDKLNLPST